MAEAGPARRLAASGVAGAAMPAAAGVTVAEPPRRSAGWKAWLLAAWALAAALALHAALQPALGLAPGLWAACGAALVAALAGGLWPALAVAAGGLALMPLLGAGGPGAPDPAAIDWQPALVALLPLPAFALVAGLLCQALHLLWARRAPSGGAADASRAEARLDAALAASHAGLFEFDATLRYAWAARPPLGLDAGALPGKRIDEVFGAAEAQRLEAALKRVQASGQPLRVELTLSGADGPRQLEHLIAPDGDRLRVSAVDVSERRQERDRHREEQQLFRVAQDQSLDPFEVLEPVWIDGRIADFEWVYINPAGAAFFGASVDALIGRRLLAGRSDAFQAARHAHWVEVMEQGEPKRADFERHEGGRSVWYHTLSVSLGDRLAATTRDASSQMRWLEAERAARAELQRAAKLQDDFLANISHELRTPLNAIAGWAHVLARSDAEPGLMQRAAEAIGRNARAQALLVDDLLDMNRIVRGTLAIERRPCDLAAALGRALEAATPAAAAKWIALEVDAPESGVACEGDPERLQQLFWNLIGNAIKYTPLNGKVWVALRAEAGRACVTVRDNGVGIAPALLPQLFARFQQAEGGITRRHGGLGIGLAIARRVAELHGGTLSLASEGEGRGTEATVEIPLAAAETGDAVAAAALPGARVDTRLDDPIERRHLEAAVAERGVAPLAWRRILVVEDEADSLELLTLLLRQQGAVVRAFDQAEQALAAADNGVFDLVISDLGMPGMDGLEFVRRLRQRPHAPKAIALTAYSGGARHAEALAAGYTRVETKPIAPPQFLAVVIGEIGRAARAA